MIIFSEYTNKRYNTIEECLADERQFKLKKEAEEKAEAQRKKELNDAYERAVNACEEYLKLAGIDFKRIKGDNGDWLAAIEIKDRLADGVDQILDSIIDSF